MTKTKIKPYQEIPNIAKRAYKPTGSPYWRFGPWVWEIDYNKLERLSEGNTALTEAVREMAGYEHGFHNVKVYQIQKSLSLIPENALNPRKIVVVFDCNLYVKAIIGTVGGQWVHTLSMEKALAQILNQVVG